MTYPFHTSRRPPVAAPTVRSLRALWPALALLLGACATPVDQARELLRAGQPERALPLLEAALQAHPDDEAARLVQLRARQALAARQVQQLDGWLAQGRLDEADALLRQMRAQDVQHPRLATLGREIERARQATRTVQEARAALGRPEREREPARARLRELLADQPAHGAARALLQQLGEPARAALPPVSAAMAQAFQKPVSLEFRDAPLRNVFEALARTAGVNFVFDKDVRSDARVTVFLRDVTLDEAVRVVMATQQLERKLLNETTLLVYPNTQAKQREHQDLVTRSFYLSNADVKQAQALVRTVAKTRDVHVDERLNLLVVRDTPQTVALVEHLLAGIDLPEPEVMLDVQVMEVFSSTLDELGLSWPTSVAFGAVNADGSSPALALLGNHRSFRASIANPALVATLHGLYGNTNLLANPSIRARNREKAKVQVGDKLPVFTTTAIANVQGVSTTVSTVDVGLKVEIEPTVQLDNEVTMKVTLEVTNLLDTVSGPGGSVAYSVGTRTASTSLRLKDGETQILAGLIRDEDRRGAEGVPGLAGLPLLGRLFGVQSDKREKREVVLLITPHVLRNLLPPTVGEATRAAGTDANPGAEALRLRPQARVGVAAGRLAQGTRADAREADVAAAPEAGAVLLLEVTSEAQPGGTVAVTLRHDTPGTVSGEILYDAGRFTSLGAAGAGEGRLPFELPPRGQQALVLRVRPDAPAGVATVSVGSLLARGPGGESVDMRADGAGQVSITAGGAPATSGAGGVK